MYSMMASDTEHWGSQAQSPQTYLGVERKEILLHQVRSEIQRMERLLQTDSTNEQTNKEVGSS
jgi:hypothetical protein